MEAARGAEQGTSLWAASLCPETVSRSSINARHPFSPTSPDLSSSLPVRLSYSFASFTVSVLHSSPLLSQSFDTQFTAKSHGGASAYSRHPFLLLRNEDETPFSLSADDGVVSLLQMGRRRLGVGVGCVCVCAWGGGGGVAQGPDGS